MASPRGIIPGTTGGSMFKYREQVWFRLRGDGLSAPDLNGFSKSKSMELPRSIVIGHDAIQQVGEVCANLKIGRRALVVADATTMKIAGETALRTLQEHKIKTEEYLIT